MRILSKSTAVVLAVLACSCGSVPWRNEPIGEEVNLAFTLERNLVEFSTVTIDGRRGRFILGTASQRTLLDPMFVPPRARYAMQLNGKNAIALPSPTRVALNGVADAIIGADVWRGRTIAIDYRTGTLTFQKEQFEPEQMKIYRFYVEPMVEVSVDGKTMNAIVDTSSPDTLVLPAAQESRGKANVRIAQIDFGAVDVHYANVSHARIGNRLLSRFFVTIDYGRRLVGLWNDPRAPAS